MNYNIVKLALILDRSKYKIYNMTTYSRTQTQTDPTRVG